jgi:hypothetical protein
VARLPCPRRPAGIIAATGHQARLPARASPCPGHYARQQTICPTRRHPVTGTLCQHEQEAGPGPAEAGPSSLVGSATEGTTRNHADRKARCRARARERARQACVRHPHPGPGRADGRPP